ncbi:MAG: substrate-binding domain-containing protein, partial [Candidatus Hydrothermarchaeales archaeon]
MKASTLVLVSVLLLSSGCFKGTASAEKQVIDFSDLYKNGTRIAVCDPGHCPAGRYAYMVISSIEAKDPELGVRIRGNIITNDPHVRAVLDKVITKEVDAGFVYITDAYLERDKVNVIEIPTEFSPLP